MGTSVHKTARMGGFTKISRAVLTHLKSDCPSYGQVRRDFRYGAYCAAPGMAPTAANGAVAAALTSGWATRTVAALFIFRSTKRTDTVDVFTGTDAQCAVTVQTATALAPQAARAFSPGK